MGLGQERANKEKESESENKNDFNERWVLSRLDITLPRPATTGGGTIMPMARRRPRHSRRQIIRRG